MWKRLGISQIMRNVQGLEQYSQAEYHKSKGDPDRQSPQMVLRTERRGQGRRREASKDLRRTVTKARDLCRAGGSRRSAGGTLCAQRKVVDNALPVPHL